MQNTSYSKIIGEGVIHKHNGAKTIALYAVALPKQVRCAA